MRAQALALLAVVSTLPGALIAASPGPPLDPTLPATRLDVEAAPPDPLPAGDHVELDVTVQRRAGDRAVPGPGRVDVTLDAPDPARCGPRLQTVNLDPSTGRGEVQVTCQPRWPGTWPLAVQADSAASRPGTWQASLDVRPDELTGTVEVGSLEAYRVPVHLQLSPAHLEQASVDLTVHADLKTSPLAAREHLDSAVADGTAIHRDVVARHGPGNYRLTVQATGPLTTNWTRQVDVTVPEPDPVGHLELNATVQPGEERVTLTSDTVNDDGKTKSPGDGLITRLEAERAETVNVSVFRANGDERVELDRSRIEVPADGRMEHVFAHEPLPAGRLWVQAQTGNSSVARTAQIRDLEASASTSGPDELLADGRSWEGRLRLGDPNFGSTRQDPGPVFGLPNLAWRVFHGSRTAAGFQVQVGPFEGPSEGQAATGRIPWPQGENGVEVAPGRAQLDLVVEPPPDVDPGTYRLSLYAPDGDRIGGPEVDLLAPPSLTLDASTPHPGRGLPVQVDVEDPVDGTQATLTALVEGRPVANASVDGTANATLGLPAPLPAGANVTVEATAHWPGRPEPGQPDAVLETSVPDLPARASAHPVLDGQPTPAPLDLHPAAGHTVELAYTARDPNTGPVNATVDVTGPDGPVDWTVNRSAGTARIEVPSGAPVGRYAVNVTPQASSSRPATVAVNVAPTLRLAVDGPPAVELGQDESRTVNLTVTNRGSLPVEAVTVVLDTGLDLEARIANATGSVPTGEELGVELAPGEQRRLELSLQATGDPGSGTVGLTVAGVPP